MKKTMLFLLLLSFVAVFSLAACEEEAHVHIAGESVKENLKEPTCAEDGSYEECRYCTECSEKISSKEVAVPKTEHTPGEAVKENIIGECTEYGSFESVIYCSACNAEISRVSEHMIVEHSFSDGACALCGDLKPSEGLEMKLNNGKYAVVGIGSCTDEHVIIPDMYESLPVTSIAAEAFSECNGILSVSIPDSITVIGSKAFYNSENLAEVEISYGVTKIGPYAFYGTALTHITVPGSVREIGDNAFLYCRLLESAVLSDGVEIIGDRAFLSCERLGSITLPDSLTKIGQYAFYECNELKSITLPSSLESVGTDAFLLCNRLVEVVNHSALNIEKGSEDFGKIAYNALLVHSGESELLKIDGYYFMHCGGENYLVGRDGRSSLITLPADCNGESYIINKYAFRNFRNLVSVTVPNGADISLIEPSAFEGCYSLAEVINLSTLNIVKGAEDNGLIGYYAIDVHRGESKVAQSDGYYFITAGGENYLVGYVGDETELVLPDSFDDEGYFVSEYAFRERADIVGITVTERVLRIEYGALVGCANLKFNEYDNAFYLGSSDNPYLILIKAKDTTIPSCEIHESTKIISNNAFLECRSLKTLSVPNSVEFIGEDAFKNCVSLEMNLYDTAYYIGNSTNPYLVLMKPKNDYIKSCAVNDKTKFIYSHAFEGSALLKSISIPNGLIAINAWAFHRSGLTAVELPNTLVEIGFRAFYSCASLVDIRIPDSVVRIGRSAFDGCGALQSATLSENLSVIAPYTFYYCVNLKSVHIPSGITEICESAFENCHSLESFSLGNSLARIASGAFNSCDSLKSIVIPNSVKWIDGSAFFGCSALEYVHIGKGVVRIGNMTFAECESLAELTVPENVKYIGAYAFWKCTALLKITLPSGITEIPNGFFTDCKNLVTVTIPNGVTKIGKSAFENCDSLLSIVIPDKAVTIGTLAFASCDSLERVTVGNSVSSIGEEAFMDCVKLSAISVPDSLTFVGASAFLRCESLAYNILGGVKYLGNANNPYVILHSTEDKSISSLTIGEGTRIIYGSALAQLPELVDLVIGNNVAYIGRYAFSFCTSLKNVVIPGSVKEISEGAFRRCGGLESLTLSEGLEIIKFDAFRDCVSLKSVTLPITLKILAQRAFYNCIALTDLVIEEGVSEIGEYAFRDCEWLTRVTIPQSVTSIALSAFGNCVRIDEVYYGGTEAEWLKIKDGTGNQPLYRADIHYKSE